MNKKNKTKYAFFNGEFVDIEEANINIRSNIIHYGGGIFEGIRAYWNKEEEKGYIFRAEDHYKRMINNAKIIAMDIKYSSKELIEATIGLLKKENFASDTYIRPLAYYSSLNILEKFTSEDYGFFIYAFPLEEILDISKGLNVCVSSWTRINDNMIAPRGKIVGTYVNICLVNYEAKKNGYDDGIILTQNGHVAEGGGQNVGIIRDNKFIAPPVSDDILEGITLDSVIAILKDEMGMETERRSIDRTELYISDEVFYCGTGVQVSPITCIDKRKIGDGKPGKYTMKLQELFFEIVRGRNEKYKDWLTPIM